MITRHAQRCRRCGVVIPAGAEAEFLGYADGKLPRQLAGQRYTTRSEYLGVVAALRNERAPFSTIRHPHYCPTTIALTAREAFALALARLSGNHRRTDGLARHTLTRFVGEVLGEHSLFAPGAERDEDVLYWQERYGPALRRIIRQFAPGLSQAERQRARAGEAQ